VDGEQALDGVLQVRGQGDEHRRELVVGGLVALLPVETGTAETSGSAGSSSLAAR
jgi:hypothetical protein